MCTQSGNSQQGVTVQHIHVHVIYYPFISNCDLCYMYVSILRLEKGNSLDQSQKSV